MDQKAKLKQMGICAEFVGEAQDSKEAKARVITGEFQLIFKSPESLLNNKSYRNMLVSNQYKRKLVAIAVNEAHCVKTWYVLELHYNYLLYCYT